MNEPSEKAREIWLVGYLAFQWSGREDSAASIIQAALDEARREADATLRDGINEAHHLMSKTTAERDRCLKALEPFAKMADEIGDRRPNAMHDTDAIYGFDRAVITLGDFKRAREAIKGGE